MEDAPGLSRWLTGLLLAWSVAVAAAETPPSGELVAALRSLGPPGLLWGRLAVDEESPDGPSTPLAGVEVTVSPYLPDVAAELERIRRSARDALSQYETAVARITELLRRHRSDVDAARRELAGSSDEEADGLVRRRSTDARGVFVFEDLPSGEWLVVAIRVTPYGTGKDGADTRRAPRPRDQRFLPRAGTGPAKSAEIWVARVRVPAGDRIRLLLSDRARFLVGPVAETTER